MDHPRPELKYIDTAQLTGPGAGLAGANVEGLDGDHLGVVDGFIIDVRRQLPRHVVVSAGWFAPRLFLVPIGHVKRSADNSGLATDLTRARVDGFPGFDSAAFERMTKEQLDEFEQLVSTASSGGMLTDLESLYVVPDWWETVPPSARLAL